MSYDENGRLRRVDGWVEVPRCKVGHLRHWFSAGAYWAGTTGLRLPFCRRGCGAPNPRPLSDGEWELYLEHCERVDETPHTRAEYDAARG